MPFPGMGLDWRNTPMNMKQMLGHYTRCARLVVGAKKEIALALVLSLLGILANTLSSITLKYVVDTALPTKDIKLLWVLQGVFLISVLLTSLFFILERHASYRIATRAQGKLRNELFARIIDADYLTLQEQNTSEIINAMTYAVDGLEGVLSRCVTAVLGNAMMIIVIVGVMISIDVRLTLISLLIFPVMIFLTSKISAKIDRANDALQSSRSDVMKKTDECVTCYMNIHNNGLRSLMSDRFSDTVRKLRDVTLRRNTLFSIMNRASWTLVIVPYQAVLYGVGGTLSILYGSPTIGTMLIFANFTNLLIQPVMELVQFSGDIALSANAFERIDQIKAIKQRREMEFAHPVSEKHFLEINALDYRYPNQSAQAISGLTHDFSYGETTVVWGKSGCGKSTLLKLISGLIPFDSQAHMRKDATKRWGFFPQDPQLLDVTIRENFTLVNGDLSDEDIWVLLKKVGLDATIGSKTSKLDSKVNRKENLLSVGEYKRLCLAVFLGRGVDIMLFDEPTAALDKESAGVISMVLRGLVNDQRGMIIATHDANLKDIADSLVLFD